MSGTKLQAPKGTSDILFEDLETRKGVWHRILSILRSYGFREIQTPAIEHFEIMATMAGQEVHEQIYDFLDKGGRRLGLKSDITAAVARVVAMYGRGWTKPIKIAVHDRVYRYEKPQKGRMREFWHVNAEMFGARGSLAEAELLACFIACYHSLGLRDIKIRISDRFLLIGLLEYWSVPRDQFVAVIRALDKRLKMLPTEWREEVKRSGVPLERLPELEKLINSGVHVADLSGARSLFGSIPSLTPVFDRLENLGAHLVNLRVAESCQFDFSIARASEYYTGLIFECFHPPVNGTGKDYGAIGGGGRYDHLVQIYGAEPIEAVGFAIGFERVMLILRELNLDAQFRTREPMFYVAYSDSECLPVACALAQDLRNERWRTILAYEPASFRKHLQKAVALDATSVLILGPEEIQQGLVRLKQLETGEERDIPWDSLVTAIKESVDGKYAANI